MTRTCATLAGVVKCLIIPHFIVVVCVVMLFIFKTFKFLFDKASLYVGAALSNVCLSHDSVLIRLFTMFGISRIIGGG
jgi:hypothetical protein